MYDGHVRAIVEPSSHPPGRTRRRQFSMNWRGEEVDGSTCSRTSNMVTTSNLEGGGGGGVVAVLVVVVVFWGVGDVGVDV